MANREPTILYIYQLNTIFRQIKTKLYNKVQYHLISDDDYQDSTSGYSHTLFKS